MRESFYRTAMLLGESAEGLLLDSHIVVFGVGGVGGHAAEALARCGVGRLTLVDNAIVKPSNLNRQCCAEKSTLGMPKTEAMKKRIEAISDAHVDAVNVFVTESNAAELIPNGAALVIDAVDNVAAKLGIIGAAKAAGIPVLSSMGAGNRLDPTAVRIADISATTIDPLARVMRRELKRRGLSNVAVVYSLENPVVPVMPAPDPDMKQNAPASVPFVPAAFGLALASRAVDIILKRNKGANDYVK